MNPSKPPLRSDRRPQPFGIPTASAGLQDLSPDYLKRLMSIVLVAAPSSARPETPNGAQLTRAGIERAIQAAFNAFKVEWSAWVKPIGSKSVTTAVNTELKLAAEGAKELADRLQKLTPEARWRIGALATDWAWHKPLKGIRSKIQDSKNLMELGLERVLQPARKHNVDIEEWEWDGAPEQDVVFLALHAEGLANPNLEHWWVNHLRGLAYILDQAAEPDINKTYQTSKAGPSELRGLRRRKSAEGLRVGYPVWLLIRECEAILNAAAFKQLLLESLVDSNDRPRIGDLSSSIGPAAKSTTSSRHLKKLVRTFVTALTGKENILDLLRNPMEKHKAGWVPPYFPDPYLWLSYRTAALLQDDFLTRADLQTKSCAMTQTRLERLVSELEDMISRAPAQGSQIRMPGSRPLQPGRTILSGVVR